ncbi:MAG: Rab family GTPase [Candidatus Hodarchaeota archaeon]
MGYYQRKKKKDKEDETPLDEKLFKDTSLDDEDILTSLDALDLEDVSEAEKEETIPSTPLFKSKLPKKPSSQETSDSLEEALEDRFHLDEVLESSPSSSLPEAIPLFKEKPEKQAQPTERVAITDSKPEKQAQPTERVAITGSLSALSSMKEEDEPLPSTPPDPAERVAITGSLTALSGVDEILPTEDPASSDQIMSTLPNEEAEDSEDSEDIPLASDIPEFLPEAVSRVESALENLNTHKKVTGEANELLSSESPTSSDQIIPDSLSSLSSGEDEDSEDLSLPAEIPRFFPEAVSHVESALENLITNEQAPEDSIHSSDIQSPVTDTTPVPSSPSVEPPPSSSDTAPPPSPSSSLFSTPSQPLSPSASFTTTKKYVRKRKTPPKRKRTGPPDLRTAPSFFLKMVLCGDGAVGKTSLRERFLGKGFSTSYLQTIGADFATADKQIAIMINNQPQVRIARYQIWDLAGQSSFENVRKTYYEGCLGSLMVFDITRRDSFENLPHWLDELWKFSKRGKIPLVLLGNKADMREQVPDCVTNEEIYAFLEKLNNMPEFKDKKIRIPYFETSALTGLNVEQAFTAIGDLIMKVIQNDIKV